MIADFDIAMKSALPAQYFRKYLNEVDAKIGLKYFTLYQTIISFNLLQKKYDRNLKSHERKRRKLLKKDPNLEMAEAPETPMIQKDLIVEIVRLLERDLKECFPEITRSMFIEQFKGLLLMSVSE